jgi:hypothetical protein
MMPRIGRYLATIKEFAPEQFQAVEDQQVENVECHRFVAAVFGGALQTGEAGESILSQRHLLAGQRCRMHRKLGKIPSAAAPSSLSSLPSNAEDFSPADCSMPDHGECPPLSKKRNHL